MNELADDAPLAREVFAALKQSGLKGLGPLLPRILAEAKEDFDALRAAAPVIKAGYRTTEFWLTFGVLTLNAVVFTLTGRALPLDVNATVGVLVAIYTLVRGAIKRP